MVWLGHGARCFVWYVRISTRGAWVTLRQILSICEIEDFIIETDHGKLMFSRIARITGFASSFKIHIIKNENTLQL